MTDLTGREILGYRIERRIGAGGMATVWLGRHPTLGTEVAVKILDGNLARNEALMGRFADEARIQARLRHPNIARVENFCLSPPAIVMEYVPGRSLAHMIGHEVGPIPFPRAVPLMRAILDAVEHAHDRGIVHRDLKPSNIIVTPDGHVKVMDFGIAKVLGGGGATRTGATIGTPAYMAPEQIRGARDVDARADIFALGTTFYEMLAGRLPFESDEDSSSSEFALMEAQVYREPPDPRVFYPAIPDAVVRALGRAMAKDPAARFPDVAGLRTALEDAAAAERVPAGGPPAGAAAEQEAAAAPALETAARPSLAAIRDRARAALAGLVEYDRLATATRGTRPRLAKADIPRLIRCPGHDREKARHARHVEQLDRRLQRAVAERDEQQQAADNAARQAAQCAQDPRLALQRAQWDAAHGTAYEHWRQADAQVTELSEERRVRVEEMQGDALRALDDDVVDVLDRCLAIIEDRQSQPTALEFLVAGDIAIVLLKLFRLCDELIEKSAARRTARELAAKATATLVHVVRSAPARTCLTAALARHAELRRANAAGFAEIRERLAGVDGGVLGRSCSAYERGLAQPFPTAFVYEGVVDPAELAAVVRDIDGSVTRWRAHVEAFVKFDAESQPFAAHVQATHDACAARLGQLRRAVEDAGDDDPRTCPLVLGLLDARAVEEYLGRELHQPAAELGERLAQALGADVLQHLLRAADPYDVDAAGRAIEEARLLRLVELRRKLPDHLQAANAAIVAARAHRRAALEVPARRARALLAGRAGRLLLALLPIAATAGALDLRRVVRRHAPALQSNVLPFAAAREGLAPLSAALRNLSAALAVVSLAGVIALSIAVGWPALPATLLVAGGGVSYAAAAAVFEGVRRRLSRWMGAAAGAAVPPELVACGTEDTGAAVV